MAELTWPTEPQDGVAPTLIQLLAEPSRVARHASTLTTQAADFVKKTDMKLEAFQVPSEGRAGPFTLPAVGVMPDGSHRILYAFNGPWSRDDLFPLMTWTAKVRAQNGLERVPIVLLTEPDPPPAQAQEIVSCDVSSLLCVLALPYLEPTDPAHNAALAQHTLRFLGNGSFELDRSGLAELDAFATHEFGEIPDDAYLRPYLMMLMGAFVGQAVINAHGGEWVPAPVADQPEWLKFVQTSAGHVNPMGRVSKFLRGPAEEPLTHFFDISEPGRMKAMFKQLEANTGQ